MKATTRPAQQRARKYPLDCGRVLTSEQCIREHEEKAEGKKKQEEKEKRMKERERRREEKAEQKESAKKKKSKPYSLFTKTIKWGN